MATLAANWLAQNGTGSLKGKDEQEPSDAISQVHQDQYRINMYQPPLD